MTTMKTFLPTPTKFGSRKIDYCRGWPNKQDIIKQRTKPMSFSQKRIPESDEEYLQHYQDRILNAQKRQLYPLQEDLADWLNKTLNIQCITGDNFLDILDNGVILCHLARVIHERAQYAINKGLYKGTVPRLNGRCFENAARRSFFSRDNMENFIKFCKQLGVHQNLLFESDDLVLHNQPRNVILCLLELSRITTKFNIEPPGLIELEKEIAEEEQRVERLQKYARNTSTLSWQFRPSSATLSRAKLLLLMHNLRRKYKLTNLSPIRTRSGSEGSSKREALPCKPLEGSDGIPSDHTEDEWSRGSGEDPDTEIDGTQDADLALSAMNELDRKIQQTAKIFQNHCHCDKEKCSKLSVKKVGDGKYNIAGRNVFVRLLKGRHMMVRVGGGWDTLEHFLLRHDPCQVRIMNRGGTSSGSATPQKHTPTGPNEFGSINNLQTLARTPTTSDINTFLHIRAKYRSPPPHL